jgi:diadenylate cyclase
MRDNIFSEAGFIKALKFLAPGTVLREGLENILRAKTGALIVIGESPQVQEVVDGGFVINSDYTSSSLYELAKMDGAIILSSDSKKIIAANTQLIPDPSIPSVETGIRHRSAERVAKQTGAMVISISQRRNIITLYQGNTRYVLKDIGVILTKANQAIQTLEKYKNVLDKALVNLSALEFEDMVTIFDVVKAIQRTEMVLRVVSEIEKYIFELGNEGRLVSMQMEELASNVLDEGLYVIRDYFVPYGEKTPEVILNNLHSLSSEEILDYAIISRAIGFTSSVGILEHMVSPRGYRILQKIPRLPIPVVENLVQTFGSLQKILEASIEELDDVEGIGEVRARAIKDGLRRYRDQILLDRHI